MTITPDTLLQHERLIIRTNSLVDQSVRTLTARWATAWEEISDEWATTIGDITATQASGEPLHPGQIAQMGRVQAALEHTAAQLDELTAGIPDAVDAPLADIIKDTAEATREVIASQLPEDYELAYPFARISPTSFDWIIARTGERMYAASWPLTDDAVAAMKKTLLRAVPAGWAPGKAAEVMLDRVRTGFNGGLSRALTIARTELLDAHRAAFHHTNQQTADVLAGWVWTTKLDSQTCPACIAMHGTLHTLDTPGPIGHPNCRCVGIPKTKTWAELGYAEDEPADMLPDADAWIRDNPTQARRALGDTRYRMLQDGQISRDQLATRRENPDWRPSMQPTPVRDLERSTR